MLQAKQRPTEQQQDTYQSLGRGLLGDGTELKVKDSGVRLLGARLVQHGQTQRVRLVVWTWNLNTRTHQSTVNNVLTPPPHPHTHQSLMSDCLECDISTYIHMLTQFN